MELVSTMEISGEEREIADAYAREQCTANAKGIAELNSNLTDLKVGEVAGGKNLFNGKYIKELVSIGTDYTNRNLYDEFSSVNDITGLMYVTIGGNF